MTLSYTGNSYVDNNKAELPHSSGVPLCPLIALRSIRDSHGSAHKYYEILGCDAV